MTVKIQPEMPVVTYVIQSEEGRGWEDFYTGPATIRTEAEALKKIIDCCNNFDGYFRVVLRVDMVLATANTPGMPEKPFNYPGTTERSPLLTNEEIARDGWKVI